MNSNDGKGSADQELQSWLDGTDGVSAAYRKLGAQEPSQSLDATILAAARTSSAESSRSGKTDGGLQMKGLLSLAASLMLGVMIGSVFLGNFNLKQDSATEAFMNQAETTTVLRPAAVAESDAVLEESTVTGSRMLSTDIQAVAEQAVSAELADRQADASLNTRQLGITAELRSEEPRQRLTQAMQVNASPLAAENNAVDWRQSRERWLEQILLLQNQRDASSISLAEEVSLFMQTYPQADIEQELLDLQSSPNAAGNGE